MTRRGYIWLGLLATLLASALLALQLAVGWEYTEGASPATRASMLAAIAGVGIIPLVAEIAARVSRLLALVLVLAWAALFAYSVPASIGRSGEVREAKALAADDAGRLRQQLDDIERTLRFARPDMERECQGAPSPLPADPKRWSECRRKRGSVIAFDNDRARIAKDLAGMGNARLGDTASVLVAWAIGAVWRPVEEETVRRATAMALPIGFELALAAFASLAGLAFRLAATCVAPSVAHSATGAVIATPPGKALTAEPAPAIAHAEPALLAEPAPSDALPAPGAKSAPEGASESTPGAKSAPEGAANDSPVLAVLRAANRPMTNDQIRRALGYNSKGAVSELVSEMVAAGLVRREQNPVNRREVIISLTP